MCLLLAHLGDTRLCWVFLFFFAAFNGFKANGYKASRAVSSHVFTRTCNMNGALSGCTRGEKCI